MATRCTASAALGESTVTAYLKWDWSGIDRYEKTDRESLLLAIIRRREPSNSSAFTEGRDSKGRCHIYRAVRLRFAERCKVLTAPRKQIGI